MTLTAASQLGFRGNDVQMMFCSCLAVCLLLQHPSQCEYLVPTRTKKSLQSYIALGKLLLLLTAPSAHRQKLPQGLSWRGPPISPLFGRFGAGLGAPAPSCRDLPAKPSRWGVTKAEAAGRREGEPRAAGPEGGREKPPPNCLLQLSAHPVAFGGEPSLLSGQATRAGPALPLRHARFPLSAPPAARVLSMAAVCGRLPSGAGRAEGGHAPLSGRGARLLRCPLSPEPLPGLREHGPDGRSAPLA